MADIGVNTLDNFINSAVSPVHASEQSSLNTPSNALSDTQKKSRLFKKYNSNKFNTINASGVMGSRGNPSHSHSNSLGTRKYDNNHSVDLEKQYVLQQKYKASLQNYPQTRLTPQAYESLERPNSVTGSIKLRKSYDFNPKNAKLDMYNLNKNSSRKLSNSRYHGQGSAQ